MDVDLVAAPDGFEVARQLRTEHDVASLCVSDCLDQETRARALEGSPVGSVDKLFVAREILRPVADLRPRVAALA